MIQSFYLFCMVVTLVVLSAWFALLAEVIIEKILNKKPDNRTWDISFAIVMSVLSWAFRKISGTVSIFAVGIIIAIFILGKTLLFKKEKMGIDD